MDGAFFVIYVKLLLTVVTFIIKYENQFLLYYLFIFDVL